MKKSHHRRCRIYPCESWLCVLLFILIFIFKSMAKKNVLYGDAGRLKMLRRYQKLHEAVLLLLPLNELMLFSQKSYGAPQVTNDGVTIAKKFDLEDQSKIWVPNSSKDVASKTNDAAGDGYDDNNCSHLRDDIGSPVKSLRYQLSNSKWYETGCSWSIKRTLNTLVRSKHQMKSLLSQLSLLKNAKPTLMLWTR